MKEFTCFLIDDDPDDRDIFTFALEGVKNDYKCITAENGVRALEILAATPDFIPDIIFIDLNMPLLSGKQCLKEIKKIPRLKDVKIVIYTTSSYEEDIKHTQQLGANHYLVKPASVQHLSNALLLLFQKQKLPFTII